MRTNVEGRTYLDSSALVKLVIDEKETAALRRALAHVAARTSCGIARVEVVRAVRAHDADSVADARATLEGVELIGIDDALLDRAADLDAPLRSLDAIHLAAALSLGDALDAVVTYDARMTRAAESLGVPVVAPA